MTVSDDKRLAKGIDQFNAGNYFECHETLESLWMEEGGPDRFFIQGLIHLAVGLYHLKSGNRGGALSQLAKAAAKLKPYTDGQCGVRFSGVLRQTSDILLRLQKGEPVPWGALSIKPLEKIS